MLEMEGYVSIPLREDILSNYELCPKQWDNFEGAVSIPLREDILSNK